MYKCDISITPYFTFRMESILVNMINKMKNDRSRIDNGADPLKFPNFPSLNADEVNESEVAVQTNSGNDFEEVIETMRR